MSELKLSTITAILAFFSVAVQSLCDCGYRLSNGDRYTHRIHNNFSKFEDTTDEQNLIQSLPDWYIMGWRAEGDSELHTIPRQNDRSNVWIKDGVLYMRQRAHPENSSEPVSVSEINTRQDDMLYGSFRMLYKVSY